MDNFAEQLVRKEPTSSDRVKKAAVYAGGILITVILILFAVVQLGSAVSMVCMLLAVAAGYGTFFLGQSSYVEYEYTFTNGELDIDKIVAKKKRTSLITADVKKFTAFGKYNDNLPETSDMTVVVSSDNIASHEYYADFEHGEYGKVRLIFSPNEKMLENIKRSLPRTLKNLM